MALECLYWNTDTCTVGRVENIKDWNFKIEVFFSLNYVITKLKKKNCPFSNFNLCYFQPDLMDRYNSEIWINIVHLLIQIQIHYVIIDKTVIICKNINTSSLLNAEVGAHHVPRHTYAIFCHYGITVAMLVLTFLKVNNRSTHLLGLFSSTQFRMLDLSASHLLYLHLSPGLYLCRLNCICACVWAFYLQNVGLGGRRTSWSRPGIPT